ncbi:hypothetical protein D8682_08595 [Buttiauxella sp. 3AFRM03]|uniref:VasL domain-containing protein n=1 Tax=Buttiauxella sp. 3AFRM03 TaxID=2479367 RepID=UPI000EF79CD8|nr:VasL domain-containing protein [Buttiauxella sp. 3AFRM03]AYN27039.1 hypothetical protein D8682_08595 [Buttiauxella sp. 3AFRM03]
MNNRNEHRLKTGGDPRTLADFAALREELSKLTHPARPDVSWQYVETLCLNLFERNGVELQTAAWYTQARTRLAGLCGLNEGLAIITALMTHQWGTLWPQATHARMEIISGLSLRLQQMLRTVTLVYADLGALYQAEKHLSELGGVLQRLELKHVSQMDALRNQLHAAAVRLENSEVSPDHHATSGIVLPATVGGQTEHIIPRTALVYVAQAEPAVRVETLSIPVRTTPWKPFIAGMATMMATGSVLLYGWNVWHQQSPEQVQLQALVAPPPAVLSAAQIQQLQQQKPAWLNDGAWLEAVQQRLVQLTRFPPDQALNEGNQLVRQTQALWPTSPQALHMAIRWQQHLNDTAIPAASLSDWHQGMVGLQQLADRLNGLDEKRGKYMTVSELKSVVFAIQQSFNRTPPAEERLRQLSKTPSLVLENQTEAHLKQLISRYALLKQNPPD